MRFSTLEFALMVKGQRSEVKWFLTSDDAIPFFAVIFFVPLVILAQCQPLPQSLFLKKMHRIIVWSFVNMNSSGQRVRNGINSFQTESDQKRSFRVTTRDVLSGYVGHCDSGESLLVAALMRLLGSRELFILFLTDRRAVLMSSTYTVPDMSTKTSNILCYQ